MNIELQGLTKRFPARGRKAKGETTAVQDLTFTVPDGKLVGLLGITRVDPQVSCVTLDFILHPRYTGQGFASAAVRACTGYLFQRVDVRRIQCLVLPHNRRATLVLERCGFVKEGTIREGFYWPDKGIVDCVLYSLLPTDLRPKKAGPAYYL